MEHLITAMVVRTDDLPEQLHVVDDARALLIRHGWIPPTQDVVLDPDDHERVSFALGEARTVLSRSETALGHLTRMRDDDRHAGVEEALTTTVVALEPYRRTRRRKAAA